MLISCRCPSLRKCISSYGNVFIRSFSIHRLSHLHKKSNDAVVNHSDPYMLTKTDLADLHDNIRKNLHTGLEELDACCHYYFDGQGKLFRPMTIMLMGKACNTHLNKPSALHESQRKMAMIAEMIHTASLLHDDVIDEATTRRNKPSVNNVFTHKQAILGGDMIMSRASILLAQLGNTKAVEYYSQIINDLVKGELTQLVSKDDINDRFNTYIQKTFHKTASLIAYSCKSVALFAGGDETVQEKAFQYGKNIGISFQLIDDALDFVASSEAMGKPTGADLNLGLATAPVLFAAHKFPDLHALIGRRFRNEGDVGKAFEYVNNSDGVNETYMLARSYAKEATKSLETFQDSVEKEALVNLTNMVVDRNR